MVLVTCLALELLQMQLFASALSPPIPSALLVCTSIEVMYLSASLCHSERKLLSVGSVIRILAMVLVTTDCMQCRLYLYMVCRHNYHPAEISYKQPC